jgi:hypothetical protein
MPPQLLTYGRNRTLPLFEWEALEPQVSPVGRMIDTENWLCYNASVTGPAGYQSHGGMAILAIGQRKTGHLP